MRDLLDNLDKITEAPKPVAKISASTFLGFMYQDTEGEDKRHLVTA